MLTQYEPTWCKVLLPLLACPEAKSGGIEVGLNEKMDPMVQEEYLSISLKLEGFLEGKTVNASKTCSIHFIYTFTIKMCL